MNYGPGLLVNDFLEREALDIATNWKEDVLNTYFLIQRRLEGNDYVIADQEAYDRHVNTATSYERTKTTKLVQK